MSADRRIWELRIANRLADKGHLMVWGFNRPRRGCTTGTCHRCAGRVGFGPTGFVPVGTPSLRSPFGFIRRCKGDR